ncbi:MAG TPA: hypothetical protein VH741_10985 [Candidatus Limnocylindrales bacterium]
MFRDSPLLPSSRRAVPALALVALALLLAACGSILPKPSATPTSTTNHDTHAFPELEARLPQVIGGVELETVSLAAHPDRQDPKTLAMLGHLGKTANDLQLANGELPGTDLQVGAFRVVGAPGNEIIAAFIAADQADPNHTATYLPITLAGHNVTARTVEGESTFLYGLDDIMFIVRGERSLVEEALRQLG